MPWHAITGYAWNEILYNNKGCPQKGIFAW